jgi:hypothetical protein
MILSRDVRRPFIPTMRCWLTRAQSRRQFSRGCWLWDSGSKCASHRDSGLTIPKSSTLVTSDRSIEDWGALLGDAFVQGW